MKIKHTLTLLFSSLILFGIVSCESMRPLTSSVKPHNIQDLQFFETRSYISLVEKGNKAIYNDSLSIEEKTLVNKVLHKFLPRISITNNIVFKDSVTNLKLNKEINGLFDSVIKNQNVSNVKLTPMIDSMMNVNNKRFGLIIYSAGFTRTENNFRNQHLKGAGIAVLTLGMYYQVPIIGNLTMHAMVVDAKEKNVAFYKKTFVNNKDPLDEKVVSNEIQKMFDGYFPIEESKNNY